MVKAATLDMGHPEFKSQCLFSSPTPDALGVIKPRLRICGTWRRYPNNQPSPLFYGKGPKFWSSSFLHHNYVTSGPCSSHNSGTRAHLSTIKVAFESHTRQPVFLNRRLNRLNGRAYQHRNDDLRYQHQNQRLWLLRCSRPSWDPQNVSQLLVA